MTETKAVETRKLVAADVMAESSPLHKSFVNFCGENKPTKRQARKFLQKYPQYRSVDVDIPAK